MNICHHTAIKKVIMTYMKISLTALLLLIPGLSVASDNAYQQIEAQVTAHADYIDQTHGVLLSGQERNNVKITLVANRVAKSLANDANLTLKQAVDAAAIAYDINDPSDQRQLLIESETTVANAAGSGGGRHPPCCK